MFIEPGKLKGKAIELSIPLCVVNKHTPDRKAARWDGTHYVSYCLDCAKSIRRKARNDWRKEWIKGQSRSRRKKQPPFRLR